jgi:hypothetical protein
MISLVKSSTMRCLLKKPTMSRIYPRGSFLQENKALLSKLARREKARKLSKKAQVRKKRW